ncbi:MAG: ABC transporter ATP-binding protein [Chthonomonadales bacterium]
MEQERTQALRTGTAAGPPCGLGTGRAIRQPIVEAEGLSKWYRRGREEVRALDGVSLSVEEGAFVVVTGPSGSGKTTLLQIIGAMDRPTSGRVRLAGRDLTCLRDRELTAFRRDMVGFVFQHFGLLPTLSVEENVALPMMLARTRNRQRVEQLLHLTGLWERRSHRPAELSGGEMQRVAIARALANSPRLLLADEPTGNLDSVTGERIIHLLREVNAHGVTVVVVTHNERLAQYAHRAIRLKDGRIEHGTVQAAQPA